MSSVHAFFADTQLFEGNPNFPKKLFKDFLLKKTEKQTKKEDQGGGA